MLPLLLLSAALIAPSSLRSRRFATSRTPALRADAAWLEPPPVGAWPEALCGPWEVRSSLSNAAETWVELGGDGSVQCASRVGSGAEWSGVEGSDGAWTLSVGGGQPAASGGLHGRISNHGRGPLAKCGK